MLQIITDLEKREWTLRVTVRVDKLFQEKTGRTIAEEIFENQNKTLLDGKIYDLLWFCVQPQAESKGLDANQFFDSLDGGMLEDANMKIFYAIADYFPEAQKKAMRSLLNKLQKATAMIKQQAEQMIKEIEKLPESVILSNLKKQQESLAENTPCEKSQSAPKTGLCENGFM